MLRAELKRILPNDYLGWDEFAQAERPNEPWDDFAWFSLDIGLEGDEATNIFYALIATAAAVSRAQGDGKRRRVHIVSSFEPASLGKELKEYVSSIEGFAWDQIDAKLRRTMYCEYEKSYG